MRATNHVITGAILAVTIQEPLIAVPAALLSHLVLDIIPHHANKKITFNSKRFIYELIVDASVSTSFLLFLAIAQPEHWMLAIICGVVAASPDLLWIPKFIYSFSHTSPKPTNKLEDFLARIQWCERPWGMYIESTWFMLAMYTFFVVSV